MKTQIFIPYLLTPDDGEELKIALRSIERNILFDVDVVIAGTSLPTWINKNSIIHINKEIEKKIPYNTFWDTIGKLRNFTEKYIDSEQIIYTYDDIVFMQGVTLDDVKLLIALSYLPNRDDFQSDASANWKKVLINTMHKLKQCQLPYFNFETHLPIYMKTERLRRFFVKFGFNIEPYHLCSLYCNWVNDVDNKPVFIINRTPEQKMKYGIYTGNTICDYSDSVNYRYMNWAASEWKPALREFLFRIFPEKSRFEV